MRRSILAIGFILLFDVNVEAFETVTTVEPNHIVYNEGRVLDNVEAQTDVNNAKFVIREGIPYLEIDGIGEVFHPAWTGLYALQYAGCESYYPKQVEQNEKLFFHLVDFLEKKLSFLDTGGAVWWYEFDNTYNNVYIKAPWSSAFAQAIGVEVFVTAYEKTKNNKYLELAHKVAKPLLTPINRGGLLYTKDEDIWFEEIPLKEKPTHILNAHLRSLIALDMLYKSSQDSLYKTYFNQGLTTLQKWLPRYDSGYWLKYDLNPNYLQQFRITNPYGFETVGIAIDSISILDKQQNELLYTDLGDSDDFDNNQPIYLSGVDWQTETYDNHTTLRKTKPTIPADFKTEFDAADLVAPYSFLNIRFPATEEKEYFVKIDYKDYAKGNLVLQKRAITPHIKFNDVKNGIFLLNGDKQNKTLIVKIDESDLGFHVGLSYAWNHYLYLDKLKEITQETNMEKWANIAKAYLHTIEYDTDKLVRHSSLFLPEQTPVVPLLSLTKDKVVSQHFGTNQTGYEDGVYDFKSPIGRQTYSPYIISLQANGSFFNIYRHMLKEKLFLKESLGAEFEKFDWISLDDEHKITKENALNWLKTHAQPFQDALVWQFDFANAYNDVEQEPGWNSAFGQAYVIKAFMENKIYDYAMRGAKAYQYDIAQGGVSSFDKANNVWFEEVPNKTHILNAHLISQNVLSEYLDKFDSSKVETVVQNGLHALEKYISDFDTGYWSKYDQNPKKEVLFQLDWLVGEKSPLIDEVCLISSVSHKKSCVDIGSDQDYQDADRITGVEWLASFKEDGKTVRNFQNGYIERAEPVEGGAHHNAFIRMSLPDRSFVDQWDITPYYLEIKYKDIAKGQFVVKIQSVREGNFLEFMPLYGANLMTSADGQWKRHIVPIRTNDLGWFLGIDYHKYHIEQLNAIVAKTQSLVLSQVVKRWQFYLEQYTNKQSPIVEPQKNQGKELHGYHLSSNLQFYPGSELEKAIDGDSNSNYVAALENIELPHQISIDLKEKVFVQKLQLLWESDTNNAKHFFVQVYDGDVLVLEEEINNEDQLSEIELGQNATKLVLNIKQYNGQNRLLMRAIKIFGR